MACSRATRNARGQAAKGAQAALDRLLPLRARTEEADNLDKAIVQARAEVKAFKATGDSDNSLASMPGANAATLSTAITLLLALGIELANKYGPYWTFRFLIGGLGYPQPRPMSVAKRKRRLRRRARLVRRPKRRSVGASSELYGAMAISAPMQPSTWNQRFSRAARSARA